MDTPQVNIAIEELCFSLFQRPLHPELFQIYAKREIKTNTYEAIIWVTGCTHVISVFRDNQCLTEVVSGPGQMLPERGLIERFHFRGPKSHKCTLSRNISYITNFQVERMNSNLYRQSCKDLQKFGQKHGIFIAYPQLSSGALEPFCFIDFEARSKELHVHAFAAYPDQITMVKTQSLFDFNS